MIRCLFLNKKNQTKTLQDPVSVNRGVIFYGCTETDSGFSYYIYTAPSFTWKNLLQIHEKNLFWMKHPPVNDISNKN